MIMVHLKTFQESLVLDFGVAAVVVVRVSHNFSSPFQQMDMLQRERK